MSDIIKVEIRLIDETGQWQWLGKLTKEKLKTLCAIADVLSDESVEDNA